jgi:Activator of Hsp90 ATPase homolog 1-like protein
MSEVFAPIAHDYELSCGAGLAFEFHVGRIGEWWDPRYTANPETLETVTIEPWVGGRVYATHSGIARDDWGEVTVWEPGRRLAHTFTLAQDAAHPSEVEVEFFSSRGGCRMRFAHGGWTEDNAAVRPKFGDWGVMLDRFAALAEV